MFICGVLEGAIEHYREGLLRAFHGVSTGGKVLRKKMQIFLLGGNLFKKSIFTQKTLLQF